METTIDTFFLELYRAIEIEAAKARIAFKQANVAELDAAHNTIDSLSSVIRFAINAPESKIKAIADKLSTGKYTWTDAVKELKALKNNH